MKASTPRKPAASARAASARQRTDFVARRTGFPAGQPEERRRVEVERAKVDDGERRLQRAGGRVQRGGEGEGSGVHRRTVVEWRAAGSDAPSSRAVRPPGSGGTKGPGTVRGRIAARWRRSATSFCASPTANPVGRTGRQEDRMSRRRTAGVALWVLSACLLLLLPVAEAAAAKRVFGSRALHQGSKGRDVRVLQDFLTRWGVITHVDGVYGPVTAGRVRAWERLTGRPINGRMSLPDTVELRRQVEAGEYRPDRTRPALAAAPVARHGPRRAPARRHRGGPGRGARGRRGHDRLGERDPRLPVQVRRRPRPLERHGLRLLRLHVLRAARRGPAQDGPRLVGLHELGRAGPGRRGSPTTPTPATPSWSSPASGSTRAAAPRTTPAGTPRCGRPAATPSATQPVSRRPRVR